MQRLSAGEGKPWDASGIRQSLGSRDIIRTVSSFNPTARNLVLNSPLGTEASAMHTTSVPMSLRSLASDVHFEVDQFATGQSNDHLTLVDGTFDNLFFGGCSPFIDSFVGTDVSDAFQIDLYQRVFSQL
ncbi:hypothetical protein BpHYR1_040440 [Brachionus plicatilis]|uniref:Uncharacterized protein n=1 Tax=Brachionus plicatilis TaxID=10195 RepID=A0A3M7QXA4_BRAPC|nr:hypothetical protein BpHYR1_040440 [Brachionus plicatilis]